MALSYYELTCRGYWIDTVYFFHYYTLEYSQKPA